MDKRRKKLGLVPLSEYAPGYGFSYQLPLRSKARLRMTLENSSVDSLLKKGYSSYKKGDFGAAYDAYNMASAVAGGMSDHQSLKAARVFATISARDPDKRYAGIALDFLYLLKLRGKLKPRVGNWKSFIVLHGEPRWAELVAGGQR